MKHLGSKIIALILSTIPVVALAATPAAIIPPKPAGAFDDLPGAITRLYNFGIVVASIIFVVLFLVGGLQYLGSAGNEQATGKAKRLLVDAVIGLIIVLAAWAGGNFILSQLGVNLSGTGSTTPTSAPTQTTGTSGGWFDWLGDLFGGGATPAPSTSASSAPATSQSSAPAPSASTTP